MNDIKNNITLYMEKLSKFLSIQQKNNQLLDLKSTELSLSYKLDTSHVAHTTDIIILSYLLNKINQGKINFIIAVGDNHALNLYKF